MPHIHAEGAPERSERAGVECEDVVRAFIEHVSAGRAAAAAELWDLPGLVLGDRHVHGPLSREPLARLFADVATGHSGWSATTSSSRSGHPGITRQERLAERVASVDVNWPERALGGFLDAVDATTFLVRLDEQGLPKIRALLLRTRSAAPAARAQS